MAGIFEAPRPWRQRRRKGGEEEEGQPRRCGGVGGDGGGGPAADHGRRAIRDPARGAYDLLVGRGEAPVIRGARRSGGGGLSAKRAIAYALDRLERAVVVGAAR